MKKSFMRTIAVLLSALVLLGGIGWAVAGCGFSGGSAARPTATSAESASSETTESGAGSSGAERSLTDHAGRTHTLPAVIETVYCTSPMGTNLMYMLAPEMMVGWNITPTDLEKKYIPEEYRQVVGLGGWFGKNTTGNIEEIIKRAPDVVINLGELDEAAVSEAERIQGLLNIPVVMVDGDLPVSGAALRFIGEFLDVSERAEELAAYCDDVIEEAERIAAGLAPEDKVRVYYAEGPKGLNTDPEGSMHTEVLQLVGGANVAEVSLESDYGMSPVSLEQVLVWDPELILVASDPAEESRAYEQITTLPEWATIAAVKAERVYQIPRGPFDWFDRPPSISRILGVRWLGNLLYPDLYQYDMRAEVKRFYATFYHIDLTDEQFEELTFRALEDAEAGDLATRGSR